MVTIKMVKAQLSDLFQVNIIEAGSILTTWTAQMIADCFDCGDDIWLFNYQKMPAVLGYAICRADGQQIELLQFCLAVSHRGKGVGQLALQQCLLHYRDKGLTHFTLEVAVDNPSAIHCYQRLGFTMIGNRKAYYTRGKEKIDAYVMQFSLEKLD